MTRGKDEVLEALPFTYSPNVVGAITLRDIWPWVTLIAISIVCITVQGFGLFHNGLALYLYMGACIAAMCLGFVGLVGYVHREMARTRQALRYSNLIAAKERFYAEMEAREPGSGDQWKTVVRLAGAIGGRMGLGSEEVERLRESAGVMDVGMLASLDRLEDLPPGEAPGDITRLHPLLSESILGDIYPDWPILPIVRHHHESFDGTGYPDGLKGDEIPPSSRTLSVADALAVLTSRNPGREPLSMEEAVRELAKDSGTKYDPEIIEVLARPEPLGG